VLLGAGEGQPIANSWFAKAGPVPWPMRWPQPRVRPASKSEPARNVTQIDVALTAARPV